MSATDIAKSIDVDLDVIAAEATEIIEELMINPTIKYDVLILSGRFTQTVETDLESEKSKPSTKRKKSLSACKPNFSAMNLYPHLYMTNSTQTYDRLPDPILSGNQFVSQNNSQNNQQQRLRSLGTMNYQNGQGNETNNQFFFSNDSFLK